jgi:iron complex outermembrane receptor protein
MLDSVWRGGAVAIGGSVALWAAPAWAQDNPADSQQDEIIVTGVAERQLLLDTKAETGSRLGLTARETPATVDIISSRQIEEIGARTNVEVLNRAPGVTSSLVATSPGVPSMRGFTGDALGLFYDGVRVGSPAFFTRTTDSWLYDRVEILKGPASVMYGEGALAGAINMVPKKPNFAGTSGAALLSYGSFDTLRAAGDINFTASDAVAVRGLASYQRTSGYVDDTDSHLFAGSLSATFRLIAGLSIELSADYSEDAYNTADYGIPLVPAAIARDPSGAVTSSDGYVIDRALSRANYNFTDGVLDSDTLWLRSHVVWDLGGGFKFENHLSKYHSDRHFINSEIYTYNAASGLIDRTTGIITHDIDNWVERPSLTGDVSIGGMRNRFAIGAEFSEVDFRTRRYFGDTTAVDPFAPVRGTFPGGSDAALPPVNSFANAKVKAIFAENALNLTPEWLLIGGIRNDWIDYHRTILPSTQIDRSFSALSWRAGTVYSVTPKMQLFGQYSEAIAPVSNFFLLSLANSRFDLTTGRSVEGGVKASFWGDRIDVTLAGYWIRQDNIVTRDPNDPTLSVQGGSRSSRGVELSTSAALTRQFRVDGNLTVLDAKFDRLIEAGGIDRSGNTPPRIPEFVANLSGFYSFEALPLTLSASLRRTGRFFTDNAEAVRVRGYTAIDAAIGWRLPFAQITVRGRNLTNAFYVDYTDMQPSQFQVGAPRSVEISLLTRF